MDDYWTNRAVGAQTNAKGIALIRFQGPPCVGAVALLVTGASSPGRILDRTIGEMTNFVIP